MIPGTVEFEVYHSLAGDRHGRWIERLGEAELKALVERMGAEFRRHQPVAQKFASRHASAFDAH